MVQLTSQRLFSGTWKCKGSDEVWRGFLGEEIWPGQREWRCIPERTTAIFSAHSTHPSSFGHNTTTGIFSKL